MQRPVNVEKTALTELNHLFLFPPLDEEDAVEARRGLPFLKAPAAIDHLATVPDFGYLWADRRARAVAIGDPLPEAHRLATANLIRRAPGHV